MHSKVVMKVVISNEGSNLGMIVFGKNSPRSQFDSSVDGMECCNARDVEEGKVGHIFRTEAGQVFYCVVAKVYCWWLKSAFPYSVWRGDPV